MMPHTSTIGKVQLSRTQYEYVCRKIYDICGINLSNKMELVQSRLSKRLFELKLKDYNEYFRLIENDRSGREQVWMVDALTTNKTSFYREIQHFDFLRKRVLPELKERRLRIWSAACSTGEEPYSIAIQLREELPKVDSWDIKILATDISTKVLKAAHEGVYTDDTLLPIAENLKRKYFRTEDSAQNKWRIVPDVRNMVRFARLNFMEAFPMKGPFDIIFCRNAMIYFDKPTQEKLVGRFYDLLKPGGYLLVGHSESLTGAVHNYKYLQPAVYQK